MNRSIRDGSSWVFSCLCCLSFFIILSSYTSAAQNATTDPSEVRALNSIFQQWDVKAVPLWNISGEPCSGSAINGTEFDDTVNNPAIQCDCTFDSGATCHITKLRLYALSIKGVIPLEILDLRYLTFFHIDHNYFTGPLPAFLGNLTTLQVLSVSVNAFSGTIPKELGNLKNLTKLSLGINNFSGTLPPELGNLVNLEYFFINSCGVRGEIPSTFANLQNTRTLWASDNAFIGRIPDFIGNWTKLNVMRFEGNSFEGPIPSSFSNLILLTDLRISDIYNGSSSLDFIKNLTQLDYLVLRNASIGGNIPSYIGDFQRLNRLDLSFNNLRGQVPSQLFKMGSLNYLFLGNNNLTGILPSQRSENLQAIDLSYNHLSGKFPRWISSALQLNLVANDFVFDNSNVSILPGLNCLQRNFPCNRDTPRYANFSIKCNGPEMSADGIVYEAENLASTGILYHVTGTQKWAVSNSGLFFDRRNQEFLKNTFTPVTNTDTPELFQTSRISPRYYGLGLENGPYSITLLFAETGFEDPRAETWKSLGKRVFDIYIQGHLQLKDFDISKEANGINRAIRKTFKTNVSENYVEILLLWAGKGTCCIPVHEYYGPSISALSAVSDFLPSFSGIPPSTSGSTNKTGLIVGITVSVGILVLILAIGVIYMRRKSKAENEEELLGLGPKPNTFSYAELRSATDDFNQTHKLGEGGFGPVYKGTLSDGREVAVKQLSVASHQGQSQFINEIASISAVQHRNLVKLYGCCIERNRKLLVYEYLANNSLDHALFGNMNDTGRNLHLDWPTRFNICLGTARGLAYLHEESRPRIVHRDVKASNILLDEELCPKISDFGLAKLYDDKKTHISTRVAGTIGYLAPEYAMRGHLTEKADVFGFGVVALEIISGRPNSDNNLDPEKIYLLEWAWTLLENNQSLALVDPTLAEFDETEATRVTRVALLCTQASPVLRPSMSRAISMLAGDIEVTQVISKPSYLTDWDFNDITGSFLDTPSCVSNNSQSLPTSQVSKSSQGLPTSQINELSDLSLTVDPTCSPVNINEFGDIIEEGR